jgi:hypothetical protein
MHSCRCWPPDSEVPFAFQLVLTSSHNAARRSERRSPVELLRLRPVSRRPRTTLSPIDIVGNGFRSLEDHPDDPPQLDRVDVGRHDVRPVGRMPPSTGRSASLCIRLSVRRTCSATADGPMIRRLRSAGCQLMSRIAGSAVEDVQARDRSAGAAASSAIAGPAAARRGASRGRRRATPAAVARQAWLGTRSW